MKNPSTVATFPCRKAVECKIYRVAECELSKEERDLFKRKVWEVHEVRSLYDTLTTREKKTAMIVERLGQWMARQEENEIRYVEGFGKCMAKT